MSPRQRNPSRRHDLWLVAVVLLLRCLPANAYVLPPVLIPPSPMAGESLTIRITHGVCDVFFGSEAPLPVQQSGANLRIVVDSIHEQNTLWCNFGDGVAAYTIAPLPIGNYTLQIDRRYSTVFGSVIETMAVLPLAVRGDHQPVATPALQSSALLLLGLMLVTVALRNQRIGAG